MKTSISSLVFPPFFTVSFVACAISAGVESCVRPSGCMPGLIGVMNASHVVVRYIVLERESYNSPCEPSPLFEWRDAAFEFNLRLRASRAL